MPLYEYACRDCSNVFEIIADFSDRKPFIPCLNCESKAILTISQFNGISRDSKEKQPDQPSKRDTASSAINMQENKGGLKVTIKNSVIKNCHMGISVPKSTNLKIENTKFINVKKPIDLK